MKRKLISIALALAVLSPVGASAAERLVPVGQVIGVQLRDGTVTVAAYDDALGAAARDAGLKIGDIIETIDGQRVTSAEDVRSALDRCGEEVALTVRRGGRSTALNLCPIQRDGQAKLGVYLRQGIAGIGTVTFYDPATGAFGALGHGVNSARGALLDMAEGYAYAAQVRDVKRGAAGEPGQLKGEADGSAVRGVLRRNTAQGLFGQTTSPWPGEPVPVAKFEQVQLGPAAIRSTVAGERVQEYSVEIVKIYPQDRADGRNFLLKVTDPALLAATGGIVQGMSGSPILQEGQLIGAVTHVLVGDPAVGYGIFIGNMLEAGS